jgi:hypothetical protein
MIHEMQIILPLSFKPFKDLGKRSLWDSGSIRPYGDQPTCVEKNREFKVGYSQLSWCAVKGRLRQFQLSTGCAAVGAMEIVTRFLPHSNRVLNSNINLVHISMPRKWT